MTSAFERSWLNYGTPDRVVDLGPVSLEFYPATTTDPAKIRVRHDCCIHYGKRIRSAPEIDTHQHTISTDPLTITPSIACNFCDLHGWVTEGKWIPAGSPPSVGS